MKTTLLLLFIAFSVACNQAQNQTKSSNQTTATSPSPTAEKTNVSDTECEICDFDFAAYKGDLKKEEINGLLLALNDEYMAWAIYDQINKDFNNPRPFSNIQRAEATHAERLKSLYKTYNLPIPENKWTGNVERFQSVTDACKAGVDAEIANRDLYKNLFESTKREDILIVYRALQSASEKNHLPAFQRCAEGSGRGRKF